MTSIDTLITFFGWCTILNIAMLTFTTFLVTATKEFLIRIHIRYFDINRENLQLSYFQYLGHYKIAIYLLNLMPYIALKIIKLAAA